MSKDWTLTVSSNDVKMPKEKVTEKQLKKASNENAQLKKSQDQLKSKVLKLSNAVKKCNEAGYNLTHGRTLHKLPFQVHGTASMELEVEAKGNCVESLVWLQQKRMAKTRHGADAQYMQYLSKSRITSPQIR